MSLAPTLLTALATSVAVGSISISGLEPALRTNLIQPGRAASSVSGLAPTISVERGPIVSPEEQGLLYLDGQIPALLKVRLISPSLPDAAGGANDLPPTLVWGAAVQPDVGEIRWSGTGGALAPMVITDGSLIIEPLYPQGANIAAVVQGLAPTLGIPVSEETSKAPARGHVDVIGRTPTLLREVTLIAPTAMTMIEWLVASGHPPTLQLRYGWTTVALSGDAVWTDVVSI